MADRKLFGSTAKDDDVRDEVPLGGTRAQAMQRLQIGLFGICAMLVLVGLASTIGSQANITEQAAVPDAAPTTEPVEAPQQNDPLADAGVVPDLPPEADSAADAKEQIARPIPPEQGVDNPAGPPRDTPM